MTDPTTVTATVKKPDGTVTSYTAGQITHDSTGHYHLDITVDQGGQWSWKLVGAGAVTDTGQGYFYVNPDFTAATTVGLTTLERLRLHVLRDATDESADNKLTMYGEMMSERVTDYCRRQFLPEPAGDGDDPVDHVFAYDGSGSIDLAPYELRRSDDLAVTLYTDRDVSLHVAATASQYELSPRGGTRQGTYLGIDLPAFFDSYSPVGGLARGNLVPLINGFQWQITITGRWGTLAVPLAAELAVLIAVDAVMVNPGSMASQDLSGYSVQPQQLDAAFDTDPRGGLPRDAIYALATLRRRKRVGSLELRHPSRSRSQVW